MTKRKRRKRTNLKVPAKGRLRDMADQLWSVAVRADWAGKCAVCGKLNCESHHLIPRQHEETRYMLENGIALCPTHHQWDKDISPHQNAAGWVDWLELTYPEIGEWYFDHLRPRFDGVTNAAYYCEVICRLREYVEPEDFERIVGIRFSQHLESEG